LLENDRRSYLRHIDAIRTAARTPEQVYVLRSRLRRLLVQAQRSLARDCGAELPRAPGYLQLPSAASATDREIATIANQLFSASRTICQPSEAFDERWRSGWIRVQTYLNDLERLLAKA
jgi:hypothetical protein